MAVKGIVKLTAVLLAVCLLFGCDAGSLRDRLEQYLSTNSGTAPETVQLEYLRPDMQEHDRLLEEACKAAETEENILILMNKVYEYYDVYDRIYSAYDISYINYCRDVTDAHWEEEYNYCAENISTVDTGLESLYYALAASPILDQLESEDRFGAGFFDSYKGENTWDDPELQTLFAREAELMEQYYSLYGEASQEEDYTDAWFEAYEPRLGELYVELIALRQEMAAFFGYDSYVQFAYDFYHYRDYTPEKAEEYLVSVKETLGILYTEILDSDVWDLGWNSSTEEETFAYLETAATAMGDDVAEAFDWMKRNALYDIAVSENKFPISFETFIYYYYEPYIFICPDGSVYDRLTFAHEFGHLAADYVTGGTYAGTDITEVHSQAMEYLSLFYGENTNDLRKLKLAESLTTYVEQAAYSLFEHRVYALEGGELTLDNVRALYRDICTDFGFDGEAWDSRDYVTIPHLYEQPLYMVSYVVSNDLAMQLYEMEASKPGAGLELYKEILYSDHSYSGDFVREYGLEDPFAVSRLEKLQGIFKTVAE